MEGATTENSPLVLFDVKEACSSPSNCDYTLQLSSNPYGWNAHANVLYLDQPRYVGNSFGYGAYTKNRYLRELYTPFLFNFCSFFAHFLKALKQRMISLCFTKNG
jgi:carboxypeptidase C (cathepsin A)